MNDAQLISLIITYVVVFCIAWFTCLDNPITPPGRFELAACIFWPVALVIVLVGLVVLLIVQAVILVATFVASIFMVAIYGRDW